MAVSGSWRIYGAVSGLTSGTRAVDVSVVAPSTAVDSTLTASFAVGFTAVTPPAAATAVLIIPPAANTSLITLKGITTDTGIPISKTMPTVLTLVAGSTFGLTVATAPVILTLVYM